MKTKFYLLVLTVIVMFLACGNLQASGPKGSEKNKYSKDKNPVISKTASVSQEFIFNIDSVGVTTITIRRSEWNKMLSYFDYFHKNENSVMAESYEYKKNGKTWKLNQVGLRLRGNTSRFRPQGKDYPKDELGNIKRNSEWSQPYYEYAAKCSDNDYRQSHFKVDFEPADTKRKMSECIKGVGLKRSDSLFSREIFCYNMFHQYGIWTAPNACQTKVYINIIEDVDESGNAKENISKCKVTQIDYGVYEMFEEVNAQSLQGRMKKDSNNKAENAWFNGDGDLWKCAEGDLYAKNITAKSFGCEDIRILNTEKSKSQWKYVWNSYPYDLKTNKSDLKAAAQRFQVFINELNNLSNISASTAKGIQARKEFYEKWFDVDFFIKTYAVNILLGMDDDYWGNRNNYYLYFDNGKEGSGKCYFIPFDYDNSLGNSINGDKTYSDPFKWGNGENRPLIDRLLEVPEYKEKFKETLLEVSSQDKKSPWNKDNCIKWWKKMHTQVAPFVPTKNMTGWPNINSVGLWDDGGWKEKKHFLTRKEDNYYEQMSKNIRYWVLKESEKGK